MAAPSPRSLLQTTDAVLRGNYTDAEALAAGRIEIDVRRLVGIGLLLGAIYGASLSAYALAHGGDLPWAQALSTACKLPLLFLLTLVVTFPSLYVFAALQRSTLGHAATLKLMLVAIVVNMAVLASLGPVFAFFAVSTESYHFLLLLHIVFCAVGGSISLVVLRRAVGHLFAAITPPQTASARRLLTVWCLVYGAVGAQMGWLLRPFLGAPGQPFALLRQSDGSFFEALFGSLRQLFSR